MRLNYYKCFGRILFALLIPFFIINLSPASSAWAKTATPEKTALKEEKGKSDYIKTEPKSVNEIIEDAKYEGALAVNNHVYDITKNKLLKKEINAEKKKAQSDLIAEQKLRGKEARLKVRQQKKIRNRKEDQQNINALYNEALTYYRRGELDWARAAFNQIVGIDPSQKMAKYYILYIMHR